MKVADILNSTKKTLFSFEIIPPVKGQNINELYKKLDLLIPFNPLNINITYHEAETVYVPAGDNLMTSKAVSKRPGTVALAAAIAKKYPDVITVPHIICGGHTKEDLENQLIDLNFLEINNLLLLRGDATGGKKRFIAAKGGHEHTSGLVKQISDLNNGIYLDKDLKNTQKMNFSIGVAGYPEKHIESPNPETDLKYLKEKVDAGAEYIVTQMFFDNQKFFDFEKSCRAIGINVPIIPAVKPLSKKRDLDLIPQTFNLDLPQDLVDAISDAENDEQVYQIGIEWTTAQSKELIAHGVPAVHYFSVGKTDNIAQIVKAVF